MKKTLIFNKDTTRSQYSTDGGVTWHTEYTGSSIAGDIAFGDTESSNYRSFAYYNGYFWIAGKNNIYRSRDGINWLSNIAPWSGATSAIALVAADTYIWALDPTTGQDYVSSDGFTWSPDTDHGGPPDAGVLNVLSAAYISGVGIVVLYKLIVSPLYYYFGIKTAQSGNWNLKQLATNTFGGTPTNVVRYGTTYICASNDGKVYKSADNGTTWFGSALPGTIANFIPKTIVSNGSATIFVAGYLSTNTGTASFYYTTNSTSTWNTGTFPTGGKWNTSAYDPTNNKVMIFNNDVGGYIVRATPSSPTTWTYQLLDSLVGFGPMLVTDWPGPYLLSQPTLSTPRVLIPNVVRTVVPTVTAIVKKALSKIFSVQPSVITTAVPSMVKVVSYLTQTTATALSSIMPKINEVIQVTSVLHVLKTYVRSIKATYSPTAFVNDNKFWGKLWSMLYDGTKWIGVKAASTTGVSSTNGIDWTPLTLPQYGNWSAIANNGTINVVVENGSNRAMSSTNGSTWTMRTLPEGNWVSVVAGGSTFVAVSLQSNQCATSTDGITWTARTMPALANWTSVAWNGTRFVAISDSDVAAYSTDGITWTESTMPDNVHYNSVTWAVNQFTAVASGPTNLAAKSTDGITWTRIYMPSVQDWTSVGVGIGNG